MDCLASSIESEKAELRRCRDGLDTSAKVEARPIGRCRNGEALVFPIVGSCLWMVLVDVRTPSLFSAISVTKVGATRAVGP